MKIYHTVFWFSLLFIIGEGLLISDFDIAPIQGETGGRVLGATTSLTLEEIGRRTYPATYTPDVTANEEEIVNEEPSQTQVVLQASTTEEEVSSFAQEDANVESEVLVSTEIAGTEIGEDTAEAGEAATNEQQNGEVDDLVELLNTPSAATGGALSSGVSGSFGDRVKALINKNKRVYLKSLQKQLEEIEKGLDEGGDL